MDAQINTGTDVGSVANSVYADAYKSAEKLDKDTDEGIKKIDAEAPPKPPTLTPAPTPQDRSSWDAFGSGAGFIAMFGSLLTKNPLESALNSGAAVMNAYHQQDAAQFKTAMDKWKIDTDNAWKMADYNQSLYKDLIGKDETELKLRAVSAKDQVMLHMADAKMTQQLFRDREKQLTKAKSATQAISDYVESKEQDAKEAGMSDSEIDKNRVKWFGEALAQTKGTTTPSGNIDFSTLKPSDQVPGTGLSLAAVDKKVDGIKNGASYANVGLSMRTTKNPQKDAVDDRLAEKYPDFDYTKAQLERGEKVRELASNAARTASAKAAVKEMDHLGEPMITAMKKLDPSEYPDWNSVKNAYDKKTGGPDVVKAFQAVQDFKTAFVSLMVKNGVPTDSARATSDDIASINFSLDQIEGVRDQAKITGAAVLDALEETKEGIVNDKNGSQSSGEAPEGTVIHNGDVTKIKKNGKWVTQ
jgi:hypothetical protein